MSFIRLGDNLYINTDEIEAVEALDALNTTVHTHHATYASNLPINTVLQMIANEVADDIRVKELMNGTTRREFDPHKQFFAG